MPISDQLIELIVRNENGLGLGLLALAACLEYLFPPFPGDAVVLSGAFVVARRGWPLHQVFGAILGGSAVGMVMVWQIGRILGRSEGRWARGRLAPLRAQIDRLVERFARHGGLYLALNRFLPSVRGVFFVAAGMAELPLGQVLVFGLLSALAWNGLLFALGAVVGLHWEAVRSLLATYGQVTWVAVGGIAAAIVIRWQWRRWRARDISAR